MGAQFGINCYSICFKLSVLVHNLLENPLPKSQYPYYRIHKVVIKATFCYSAQYINQPLHVIYNSSTTFVIASDAYYQSEHILCERYSALRKFFLFFLSLPYINKLTIHSDSSSPFAVLGKNSPYV